MELRRPRPRTDQPDLKDVTHALFPFPFPFPFLFLFAAECPR
jgi:hypothetical protein